MKAPLLDGLLRAGESNPEIKHRESVEKLVMVFNLMCKLEKQGDDEMRRIWITAERGKIEDFGDYNEYLEEEMVSDYDEFVEYWQSEYPDEKKWYSFMVARYREVFYYYVDSKLIFQFKTDEVNDKGYDFQKELAGWLLDTVDETIALISENIDEYNEFIRQNLPHKKRVGRIVRSDLWQIFPEACEDINENIFPVTLDLLEKIKIQSETESFRYLPAMTAGDFFRFCEMGYDANGFFDKDPKPLTAREKYISMADGRDYGLTKIDENSVEAFEHWFRKESHCGGHPFEICRGGNSTHISLYVGCNEKGWYLRLQGSSRGRVIETVKIAVALFQNGVPFILGEAYEILRMVSGKDYIGIVPETVFPRYCHGFFPKEDRIIDFMNLGWERADEMIEKAYWYPIGKVKLAKKTTT